MILKYGHYAMEPHRVEIRKELPDADAGGHIETWTIRGFVHHDGTPCRCNCCGAPNQYGVCRYCGVPVNRIISGKAG